MRHARMTVMIICCPFPFYFHFRFYSEIHDYLTSVAINQYSHISYTNLYCFCYTMIRLSLRAAKCHREKILEILRWVELVIKVNKQRDSLIFIYANEDLLIFTPVTYLHAYIILIYRSLPTDIQK